MSQNVFTWTPQFPEPESIDQGAKRLEEIKLDLQRMERQLSESKPRGSDENQHRFWDWQGRTRTAVRIKQRQCGDLKRWLAIHEGIANRSITTLFLELFELSAKFSEEDMTPEEIALIAECRVRVQAIVTKTSRQGNSHGSETGNSQPPRPG